MQYTLTLTWEHYQRVLFLINDRDGCEGATFIICGRSNSENEHRFLSREILAVRPNEYLVREPTRLSLTSSSYTRAVKLAGLTNGAVLFVHSHPTGIPVFSDQDNNEEPKLMQFIMERNGAIPGSILLSAPDQLIGRVWVDNDWVKICRIRLIGQRFLFFDDVPAVEKIDPFYDRQVRAFGPDIQRLLKRMHIGVVGAGGTGSAVSEQLTRLGIGNISIFDGDRLDDSNISRVYGSTVAVVNMPKAEILANHLKKIGLGTEIKYFSEYITKEKIAKELKTCEIIFCCTDNHSSRGILNELSAQYLIPLIDMGVLIESKEEKITEIYGRVTTVLPNEACLFCRKTINPDRIRLESLSSEERKRLVDERYAPELDTLDPAVISFTTAVAAQAISEVIHRLTGFMGDDRLSTEVLMLLASTEIHRNHLKPEPNCICSKSNRLGRGDSSRSFLGLSWAS